MDLLRRPLTTKVPQKYMKGGGIHSKISCGLGDPHLKATRVSYLQKPDQSLVAFSEPKLSAVWLSLQCGGAWLLTGQCLCL